MKRSTLLLTTAFLLAFAAPPSILGQGPSGIPDIIVIQVSPQTLNLDWNTQGDPEVTVHAEVPFVLFVGGGLEIWLGNVQAEFITSDARGDLVAKFPSDAVMEQLGPGFATLTLEAYDREGNYYFGTDEVKIIAR